MNSKVIHKVDMRNPKNVVCIFSLAWIFNIPSDMFMFHPFIFILTCFWNKVKFYHLLGGR